MTDSPTGALSERALMAKYEALAQRVQHLEDGTLIWVKNRMRALNGKPVGRKDSNGYARIHTKGRMISVHRLIWFIHHGWLPDVLDHIDGNVSNNRIENLRPATRLQNSQNAKMPKNNTTGAKGVYRYRQGWMAGIRVNGKQVCIGKFTDFEAAVTARKAAEAIHFGEFAR